MSKYIVSWLDSSCILSSYELRVLITSNNNQIILYKAKEKKEVHLAESLGVAGSKDINSITRTQYYLFCVWLCSLLAWPHFQASSTLVEAGWCKMASSHDRLPQNPFRNPRGKLEIITISTVFFFKGPDLSLTSLIMSHANPEPVIMNGGYDGLTDLAYVIIHFWSWR